MFIVFGQDDGVFSNVCGEDGREVRDGLEINCLNLRAHCGCCKRVWFVVGFFVWGVVRGIGSEHVVVFSLRQKWLVV